MTDNRFPPTPGLAAAVKRVATDNAATGKYTNIPRTREGLRETIRQFLKAYYDDPVVEVERLDAATALRVTVGQDRPPSRRFLIKISEER